MRMTHLAKPNIYHKDTRYVVDKTATRKFAIILQESTIMKKANAKSMVMLGRGSRFKKIFPCYFWVNFNQINNIYEADARFTCASKVHDIY